MGLAVAEARRVLRPGGLLFDLHPEGVPMRLEAWQPRPGASPNSELPADYERRVLGSLDTSDTLNDFTAATRALTTPVPPGFAELSRVIFDYRYFFDTLDEMTDYLEETEELNLASDALLERALHALEQPDRLTRLVLAQPVHAITLQKVS